MAGVYKRPSDKKRGKSGKWTIWYYGTDGKRHKKVGVTDKAESLRIANQLETEARLVREGAVGRHEKKQRDASLRDIAAHVEDYRLQLLARDDTAKHAKDTAGMLSRLFRDAMIESVADIAHDRVQLALGRWHVNRSARRCNAALSAVKAFARWLHDAHFIAEYPSGLRSIKPYNLSIGRKLKRRAATKDEIKRLYAAARAGGPMVATRGEQRGKRPVVWITGPERECLYRLALGTGFRANELRSLTVGSLSLDGPSPAITIRAEDEKRRRGNVQPIRMELAAFLRSYVSGRDGGLPLVAVPYRTAEMLRVDLAAAGISYETDDGILDFHALRASFITHLIQDGANPKDVQTLARHSTITLTLGLYTKSSDEGLRNILDKAS